MIERMTLVLDAFDDSTPSLSLVGLSERTGLPRSTVHRILDQMVRLRWLAHCQDGYCLGIRPLELGGLAAEHSQVREVVDPLLHELCGQTGLVAHLAVLDQREVVYLDRAGGRFAADLPTRMGGRMPAHATALGKAMLAGLDPKIVEANFRSRMATPTPNTVSDIDTLHRELARVRNRHGVAIDREEALAGVTCAAAPLPGHRSAPAAISLCGDARTMHPERYAHLVLHVAREASRALHPHRRRRAPSTSLGRPA
ncbi:IclR family transcriptional regulator [Haloechinothrix sp. YIM 98757]|uniref:IclR family transcriptional regulator n=2 Tax=Haloechinothrix aidingensis TaxID=2752311 RepID=A0A838ABF3_9PSEU|nr:IclR family transcriptional regulator [Haloechinothrix aidingensis]MBA0126569.1 IclR family transcriptional regulator [Haloechinothrix aidingensis]